MYEITIYSNGNNADTVKGNTDDYIAQDVIKDMKM